ncbi:unnamed protein product [Parnassius apollo]|uniref:(apollo) hypothetical protein n=1 Tax=Parnassius apollo TaxID=110799 RepID=A0A8S3XEA3_PARAO|nr:unnamed protein product [Parnassius apollo]
MVFFQFLVVVASVCNVFGQRPYFAGSRPIGYPELENKTTTPADEIGNRIGDGTTQRLPVEALGDRDLVDRLSKLPLDKQPFWFINWQVIEANRQKPQTFPLRPNPFAQPPTNGFGNPVISSANTGVTDVNSGTSTDFGNRSGDANINNSEVKTNGSSVFTPQSPVTKPNYESTIKHFLPTSISGTTGSKRFGDGTTQRLPIEALGDWELVDRLSKLPLDQQPFWYINWQSMEANRQKPQTIPLRPNPFVQPPTNGFGNPVISNANTGATDVNSGTNTELVHSVMAFIQFLVVVASACIVFGQRPSFAGSRPIGYPELENKTTPPADELGNRFGEGTTQRLPVEALGDRDLVDRLSKLPLDKQPFWFINWQAIEAHRQKPQTFPLRPNPFAQPPTNGFGNPVISNANTGATNVNSGTSTDFGNRSGDASINSSTVKMNSSSVFTPQSPVTKPNYKSNIKHFLHTSMNGTTESGRTFIRQY